MKKILGIVLAVLFALSCILLVACNATVTDLVITDAPKVVKRGETIDYSKIHVQATMDNGSTKTLALTDKGVTYEEIDVSVAGVTRTLSATYGGKTAQTTVSVTEGLVNIDEIIVTEFNNTDGYNAYLEAKKEQDADAKELEFYNRNDLYKVGTANGYKFIPEVTALDAEDDEITLQEVVTSFKLYHKEGSNFNLLSGNSLDQYLEKVESNVYYFTSDAEHETFKLEVTLSDVYELLVPTMKTTVEQTFEVVSGYNVYEALGLSVLDNRNIKSWATLKTHKYAWDNGKALSEFTDVEQVILHNNITVKASDLPANYFWKAGDPASKEGSVSYTDAASRVNEKLLAYLPGSLKEVYLGEDWENGADVHQRGLYVTDAIGLSGNYLKVDYTPNLNTSGHNGIYVVHDFNQEQGKKNVYPECHYSLISYRHENVDYSTVKGNRTVENVYFVGQTGKTENDAVPAGLMMVSSNIADLKINNTIGAKWFCNATLDGLAEGTVSIDGCKFYDSFSQMVYSYGHKAIDIKHSEMKRAGGPIFILQTRTGSGENDARNTQFTVDSMANMESWVAGKEMWFSINMNGSETIVQQMLQLASLSDYYANTHYMVSGKANLVAVVIPQPSKVMTNQEAIPGTVNVNGDQYGMDNPVFNALINLSDTAADTAALVSETGNKLKGQLGENEQYLPLLTGGFTQLSKETVALEFAPIYKCGNAYAYTSPEGQNYKLNSLEKIVGGLAVAQEGAPMSLYQGVQAIIAGLAEKLPALEAGGESTAAMYATVKDLYDRWIAIQAKLAPLATLDVSNWNTSWTAGQLSFWVNPKAMGETGNKHFLVIIGESKVAAAQ